MAEKIASGVNELGFLSPDISLWVQKHKAANPEAFSISADLSRFGLQALRGATPPGNDNRKLLIAILFARCLTHYQGALSLAEIGAAPSAKALLRVLCEGAFILGATVKSADFYQRYVDDDQHRQADLIEALLQIPREHLPFDDATFDDLKLQMTALRKSVSVSGQKKLRPARIADEADLVDFYRLFYAPYSSSVHSAVRDMDVHIREDENGNIASLRFGPDSAAVEDIVNAANQIFFAVIHNLLQVFSQPSIDEQIEKLWQRQKAQLKVE